ncbi:hypothetical protein G5I_07246 [Acromyrmex echinatior]|uniref:Uncharacterized protein n=1 Tax=Acromyrmex echinatior TaxID=103372 RepID=F4WN96_ACREC|nr:hypothetical protein G5I_07246 [Acromyrmex echinatior]
MVTMHRSPRIPAARLFLHAILDILYGSTVFYYVESLNCNSKSFNPPEQFLPIGVENTKGVLLYDFVTFTSFGIQKFFVPFTGIREIQLSLLSQGSVSPSKRDNGNRVTCHALPTELPVLSPPLTKSVSGSEAFGV